MAKGHAQTSNGHGIRQPLIFRPMRSGSGRKTLILALLPLLMGVTSETKQYTASLPATPEATWAVDPTMPGNDLPPVGHSLFDRLFTVEREGQGVHKVPFPFVELIKAIEARIANKENARERVRQVLIPLGRSLQRHAAAPDYFKYPRVVVAVDSEPVNPGDPFLKDRLFLGYQQRANLIEVISYNEQHGRFEFQVVRNYRPGTKPKVFYAQRTICISCHQNGGPIFSRAAWSETAANPRIASRLLDEQSIYFDIPVNRSALDPFAIDSSTDRANLLLPYQLLWREGCGENGLLCRAQAFTAALQYRLSSKNHFDNKSTSYRERFLKVLKDNWTERWPGGIAIPDPDIPNRNPILENGRISSHVDPLVPRQPLEIWSVHRVADMERIIKGIGEAISISDIKQLDSYLFERGQRAGEAMHRLDSTCAMENKNFSESKYRVSFNCRVSAQDRDSFATVGRLYVDDGKVTDGVIDILRFTDGTVLKRVGFSPAYLRSVGGRWHVTLDLYQHPSGLRARLPTGNALHSLELSWLVQQSLTRGDASLSVLPDFDPVRDAINQLTENKEKGPFVAGPFQAARTVQALFKQLGMDLNRNCCSDADTVMPEAILDRDQSHTFLGNSPTLKQTAGIQALYRFCASCHLTDANFPPSFLVGDTDRVAKKLAQCAPRILYRLNMWQVPEVQRVKSPMPPANSVQAAEFSVDQWLESSEFNRLQRYIEGLLKNQNVAFDQLVHRDYDTLPACLPDT
ncbi:MAG: hypothetical protein QNI91_17400 [Arenicellales bacterium]|nr:hypothetical protein [Arenicellales bacterium]